MHGFRHTFATELANENTSVYALMKASRARVDCDIAALRRWRGDAEPRGGGAEPAVRSDRTVADTVAPTVFSAVWAFRPRLSLDPLTNMLFVGVSA